MKQSREEKNRALNSAKTFYAEYMGLKNEVVAHSNSFSYRALLHGLVWILNIFLVSRSTESDPCSDWSNFLEWRMTKCWQGSDERR